MKLLSMLLWSTCLLLISCARTPEDVQPVHNFELSRYLGTWYEVARLNHSFEEGLQQVTATYELRGDGGVKVINRGFDTRKDAWDEAIGKAYFIGEQNIGQLKVSFFGPFYGAYNVIALDNDYRYAMVCGPDRSYLWILARSPALDETVLQELVSQANALGFETDKLIYVEHK
jgi:apolipoprotein D and lipocalin family protein